jgi:hypothetical protein
MSGVTCRTSWFLPIACLAVPPTLAQAPDAGTRRADHAVSTLAAPPNLSFGAPLGSTSRDRGFVGEFLLEGSTDEKSGTASASWTDGHNALQFKAKAPLSGELASPFSLDGLGGDSSLELSYNRIQFPEISQSDHEAHDKLCERILEECRRSGASSCGSSRCDVKNLTGADREEARRLLHLSDPIWFLGAGLTVANKTFDYLDEDTLNPQSTDKTSTSWSARAGFFTEYFGFVIGSYSYVKEFNPGSAEQTVCQPLTGNGATVCADAVIGSPRETTRQVLTGEFRKFFNSGVAVAPNIQRDLENDVTLVALPVYFIMNKDGAPTGGLRLTWRSDTDTTTVSVFIGAALNPR